MCIFSYVGVKMNIIKTKRTFKSYIFFSFLNIKSYFCIKIDIAP